MHGDHRCSDRETAKHRCSKEFHARGQWFIAVSLAAIFMDTTVRSVQNLKMRFELIQPDKLMWPGKYGLIILKEDGKPVADIDGWEALVEKSPLLVMVPSGRNNERPTCIFASARDLGRVELVYQHGYIWPVNPPPSGRGIMEEVVTHLNETDVRI